MNIQKSTAHIKENKKRIIFFFKLFLYFLMFFGIEYLTSIKNELTENPGLNNAYRAAIFLLGGNILISLGRIITARIYLRKTTGEKIHGNFLLGITWISNILNVVVIIIALMLALNISPLEFLTSLTIVAAAIAILSKDYVTNMINGLIIMFTDQFSMGDTIQVENQKGTIEDITLLNLVLKNENGDKVIIPNTIILNSQVINHQFGPVQKLSFEFEISNQSEVDFDKFERDIRHEILTIGEELNPGDVSLKIQAVEKDLIRFKVAVSVERSNQEKMEVVIKKAIFSHIRDNEQRKLF